MAEFESELEDIDLYDYMPPQAVEAEPSEFGPSLGRRRRRQPKPYVLPDVQDTPEDTARYNRMRARNSPGFTPSVPPEERSPSEWAPFYKSLQPGQEIIRGDRGRIERSQSIAATLDISFGEAYDSEPGYTKSLEAKDPSLLKTAGTSLMAGIGDLFVNAGQTFEFMGLKEWTADYKGFGQQVQKAFMPTIKPPEVSLKNFANPEFYATTVTRALPTTMALVPAGVMGAYFGVAAGAAATGVAIGAFGQTVLGVLSAGVGATLFSRPLESAMEGSGAKADAIAKGIPLAEAEKIGQQVFLNNLSLAGMDIAEIAAAFTPLKALGIHAPKALLARILATTGKWVAGAGMEGAEEVVQAAFQQAATEKLGIWETIKRMNPEMTEQGMVGFVLGAGLPVAGSVFQALTERVENTMSPKLVETYQVAEQTALARGLDAHAANLEAWDAVAETPAGKAHIEKVMGELKDIAEGKPIEPVKPEEMDKVIEERGGEKEFVMGEEVQPEPEMITDEMFDSIAAGEMNIGEVLGLTEPTASETSLEYGKQPTGLELRGAGARGETLLNVQEAVSTQGPAILSQLSRDTYEDLAQIPQAELRAAFPRQFEILRQFLSEARQAEAGAVSEVRRAEGAEAPSGLPQAVTGGVVLPQVPSGAPPQPAAIAKTEAPPSEILPQRALAPEFGQPPLSDLQRIQLGLRRPETPLETLVAETPPPEAPAPRRRSAQGRFISEEAYQAAIAAAKEKASGLHAGIDPTILKDWAVIGAYHIESGLTKFADWSKAMLDRLGAQIQPHLQAVWDEAQKLIAAQTIEKVKGVEAPTLPARAVKPQVRLTTGQETVARMIREDVALSAGMKKAEQAARIAFREGKKEALEAAKRDMRDIIIKAKVRAEQSGFREGYKSGVKLTKQELIQKFRDEEEALKETRKEFTRIIEENVPADQRGKFLNLIASMDRIPTEKKEEKILDRIAKIQDKQTQNELIEEVERLKEMRGQIHVQYQKRLQELLGDINTRNFRQSTIDNIDRLVAYADEFGMPSDVSRKTKRIMARLEGTQAFELSNDELQELVDFATELTRLGKLRLELQVKQEEREIEKAIEKTVAGTHSLDFKTGRESAGHAPFQFYTEGLNAVRMAEMIDGYQKNGPNGALVRRLFHKDLSAQWKIRQEINAAVQEAHDAGMTEAPTEDQYAKIFINMMNRQGANTQALTLMEKYGYQEIPALTEAEEKLIAIWKKYATDLHTDEIAVLFEKMTNQPFPKLEERIMRIKYEGETRRTPEEVILPSTHRLHTTEKGFTVERVEGVKKMPRIDGWAIFEESINEQIWFLEMQPELEYVNNIVKSKEFVKAAGEIASNWWFDHLDIIARRGWKQTAVHNSFSEWLKNRRINLGTGILGWRVSTMMVQPAAIFDAMAYMQSQYGTTASLEVLGEFSKSWIVPGYAKDYIESDPTHALSLRKGGEVSIEETLQKYSGKGSLYAKFLRGGMAPLLWADIKTAAGVQQGVESVLQKHGLSEAEAKQEAALIMDMSQSSSDVSLRPHILAWGEGARTWLTFQTFALNQTQILAHDIITKGLIKGEAAGRMSAIVALGIYVAGFLATDEARRFLYETIKQRKLEERRSLLVRALLVFPASIPQFGNIFAPGSNRAGGEVPLTKVISDFMRAFMAPTMKEAAGKAVLRGIEAAALLAYGVPGTSQFFDFVEGQLYPEKKSSRARPKREGSTRRQ